MKKFLTVLLVIAVMFTFSFSSAFATVTDVNTLKSYDVASAKAEAYQNALASLDLASYDVAGQYTLLQAFDTLKGNLNGTATLAGVYQAYATFVASVAAITKTTDASKAAAEYAAKINAYANLLKVVTGDLYATWTNATYSYSGCKTVAEVEAKYAADVKAVNKIANTYVELATKPDTTVATAAEKVNAIASMTNYVTNNCGTEVGSVALYVTLKGLADEAIAKINAATTKAEVNAIKEEYLGNSLSTYQYATSSTLGVYKKAAVKGLMPAAVKAADIYTSEYEATTKAEGWTQAAEWLNSVYNLEEVEDANLASASDLLKAVNAAAANGKVKSEYLYGWTTTTLNETTPSDIAKNVKNAYCALLNAAVEKASNSDLVEGFVDAYKVTTPTILPVDQYALVDAKEAYDDAVKYATTVAEVRAAQEAFVAAVKALGTYKAANFEYAKANSMVDYAALKAAIAKYTYSYDVQAMIDALEKDVDAWFANLTVTNYAKEGTGLVDDSDTAYKYTATLTSLGPVSNAENAYEILSDIYASATDLGYTTYNADKAALEVKVSETATTDLATSFQAYMLGKAAMAVFGTTTNLATSIDTPWSVEAATSTTSWTKCPAGFKVANPFKTVVDTINHTDYPTLVTDSTDKFATSVAQYNSIAINAFRTFVTVDDPAAYQLVTGLSMVESAVAGLTTQKSVNDDKAKKAIDTALAGLDTATTSYEKNLAYNALDKALRECSATVYGKTAWYAAKQKLVDYGYAKDYEVAAKPAGSVDLWQKVVVEADEADRVYNTYKTAFSAADQKAVTAAEKVYSRAKTAADKAAAGQALIDLIVSLVPVGADKVVADYDTTLAALKTLAASYFAKYESKVFTSAATNREQLRDDIVGTPSFNMDDVYVTTKNVAKGIQVTCTAVPGATEYRFYRSTSKSTGYKFMLAKTTNTYTNTSAKAGNKYYYKVTVVLNGVESELSSHTGIRTR